MSWRRFRCVGDETSRVVKECCNRATPRRHWLDEAVKAHGAEWLPLTPDDFLMQWCDSPYYDGGTLEEMEGKAS